MPNETILVVDDSIEIVRVLKEYMLAPLGYQVISAANGKSGLKLALSAAQIGAVIRILQQTTQAQQTTYHGGNPHD